MAEDQTITLKQRLNKAAKKKANLVQVGRGSSPPHHGNMTIAQIYAMAEQHITQEMPANSWKR